MSVRYRRTRSSSSRSTRSLATSNPSSHVQRWSRGRTPRPGGTDLRYRPGQACQPLRCRSGSGGLSQMAPDPSDEVELTMVTMIFDAIDPERLQSVLARYVVVSRGHPGCRNIDLAMSTTQPNRFVVIQKWERPVDQQAHFDSADMVTMAEGCAGLLSGPPLIDLLE